MGCCGGSRRLAGPHIKYLNHAFSRKFSELARSRGLDEISITHGHILGFLYHNQGTAIYQRDLEDAFNITRSSVTSVVKQLERRGYILRLSVENDARLKELRLTEEGAALCLETRSVLDQVEALAVRGLTEEQLTAFLSLCQIIETNLSEKE